ncbi:hypothetical protein MBLNU459_g6246t1 [Dothideomycetes sp. NU459]
MRAALVHRAQRLRSSSLSTVPPPPHSSDYSTDYASTAASILYRSPLPSESGLPIYILNAAAFPDAFEVDYDSLLPYVLARLPGEEELIAGGDYEVILFAGGQPDSATAEKKSGPGMGWYLQAYHVLSRAIRKRLQKLYVVHERSWVRVLIEVFGTFVSPKFRKKIVHVSTLSGLALHTPIEKLLIPPSVYLHDRRIAPDIYAPYVSGRRAFAADDPLPRCRNGQRRLPRVLRETTTFICTGDNIKTEGLFRIPPHAKTLGILREAYDRGQYCLVWRENGTTYAPKHMDPEILREVHQADTYDVPLAAALIKLWYRELRTPIFDEPCYEPMRDAFGAPDQEVTMQQLQDMLSPSSTTSFLSTTARTILTTHLLPLLATVAYFEAANRMTPENLAICFAPTLVCGSDQLADAKMTSVIRRVLKEAVQAWPEGLSKACQIPSGTFEAAIKPPEDPLDYEDPLHEVYRPQSADSERPHKIILKDGDSSSRPPALPPRPSASVAFPARSDSLSSPVKRKPAPPGSIPPRYSSLAADSKSEKSESPTSVVVPVDSVPHSRNPSWGWDEKVKTKERDAQPENPGSNTVQQEPAPTSSRPTQGDLMKELKNSLATDLAKRKPVSSPTHTATPPSPVSAQTPATSSTQPRSVSPPSKSSTQQRSVSGDAPSTAATDGVFARPTWAASSRQVSAPMASQPKPQVALVAAVEPGLTPSYVPKPRTPSPSLLQRISSMDSVKAGSGAVNAGVERLPKNVALRKASVDDLRRLYEERAGTVAKLANAASRRGSAVSVTTSRPGSSASRRGSNVSMTSNT